MTPLQCTAEKGWVDVAKRLLNAKAVVIAQNSLKRSALHLAVQNSRSQMVNVLVNAKAYLDIKDRWQKTPLHWASMNGNYSIVKRPLEAGAKTGIIGDAQETPLQLAVGGGRADIVQLFINAEADPDAPIDRTGKTPLHTAAKKGNMAVMRHLLGACAEVGALDASQETPLHYTAREGHANAAKLLLGYGADMEARESTSGYCRSRRKRESWKSLSGSIHSRLLQIGRAGSSGS